MARNPNTVIEIPYGSKINGRPTLDDNLKHLAFHDGTEWVTWCGQTVPHDHQCPPIGKLSDGTQGVIHTCWDCDLLYKRSRGLPVLPDHPAAGRHQAG